MEEKNRSWCSSSRENDQRAITIECASDTTHPYAMKDKVYTTLINLCIDICKRYGKKKLLWFANKDKSLKYKPASDEMLLTVHRWFANKACPGDWLYSKLGDVATKVTAALVSSTTTEQKPDTPFRVRVSVPGLNIRKGAGTNFTTTGRYTGKGVFTVTEVKAGPGSTAGWGRLKSGVGWISLDYATRI